MQCRCIGLYSSLTWHQTSVTLQHSFSDWIRKAEKTTNFQGIFSQSVGQKVHKVTCVKKNQVANLLYKLGRCRKMCVLDVSGVCFAISCNLFHHFHYLTSFKHMRNKPMRGKKLTTMWHLIGLKTLPNLPQISRKSESKCAHEKYDDAVQIILYTFCKKHTTHVC